MKWYLFLATLLAARTWEDGGCVVWSPPLPGASCVDCHVELKICQMHGFCFFHPRMGMVCLHPLYTASTQSDSLVSGIQI